MAQNRVTLDTEKFSALLTSFAYEAKDLAQWAQGRFKRNAQDATQDEQIVYGFFDSTQRDAVLFAEKIGFELLDAGHDHYGFSARVRSCVCGEGKDRQEFFVTLVRTTNAEVREDLNKKFRPYRPSFIGKTYIPEGSKEISVDTIHNPSSVLALA